MTTSAPRADRLRLSIDFGTAASKAAISSAEDEPGLVSHRVRPLVLSPGADAPLMLPSALYLENAHIHFGARALERALLAPAERQALLSSKTLLGGDDLDVSLSAYFPARIDPQRRFQQRDLIVLYLSYFWMRVRAALARLGLAEGTLLSVRFAQPGWEGCESPRRIAQIARLIDEAALIAPMFTNLYESPEGVDAAAARAALDEARAAAIETCVEGCVLEATAAAICFLDRNEMQQPIVAVLDMGAGTTDISAFAPARIDGVTEIASARRTSEWAGDSIDRVLMNAAISKLPSSLGAQAKGDVWRALLPQIRQLKEELFVARKAVFRWGEKLIVVQAGEVEGDGDYKAVVAAVREDYQETLRSIGKTLGRGPTPKLMAIATGGGARLPFVQKLIRAAPPRGARVNVRAAPLAPDWCDLPHFNGQLAPVFGQVSVAIGAAIAPPDFVLRV